MTNRGKDDRGVSEYRVSGYLYGAPVRQAMGGAGGHEPGRLHDLSRQERLRVNVRRSRL